MKARTILLIPLIFAIIGAFKLMDYNLYFPKDILRTSQTNLVKNGEQYLSTKVINKLPKSKLLVHFVDEKEEKNLKFYASENIESGFSILVISPSTNNFIFEPADTLGRTPSSLNDSIKKYIDKKEYDASVLESIIFLKEAYNNPILQLSLFLSNFMVIYGATFIPLFIGNLVFLCYKDKKNKIGTIPEH